MDYILSFLEGIITFISPCMLPMLPIYISYFAGGKENTRRAFLNSIAFVLGFSVVFVSLGAFAGTFGKLLIRYSQTVNIISGAIVIIFGLLYLGVLKISVFDQVKRINYNPGTPGFFSSVLFGIIFSIGWTPCVGAFLGSALMMAASSQDSIKGILMLLSFSLGLGIPFVFSALILDRLKNVFDFIKKHYKAVNMVSGILLIIIGILMMTGLMGRLISSLSF